MPSAAVLRYRRRTGRPYPVMTLSAQFTRNLYRPSAGKPVQNNSHTSDGPSARIGAPLSFQLLNSPIKLMPLALGVHMENDTPSTALSAVVNERRWTPRTSQSSSCRPSANR